MIYSINGVMSDINQLLEVAYKDDIIYITLRYVSNFSSWRMSVRWGDKEVKEKRLALGVYHMLSQNFPFDIKVSDNTGLGLDPSSRYDFSSGFYTLELHDETEMAKYRGYEVKS